jgi:hypothetical protein
MIDGSEYLTGISLDSEARLSYGRTTSVVEWAMRSAVLEYKESVA